MEGLLPTPTSFIHCVMLFLPFFFLNIDTPQPSQFTTPELHVSQVLCPVSHVTCHLSHGRCQLEFFDQVVKLVKGASIINRAQIQIQWGGGDTVLYIVLYTLVLYCTDHCCVQCTVHSCDLHCTVHFTVFCTVHCTVHFLYTESSTI